MALTTRRRALTTFGAALAGAVALPATTALAGERKHRPRPLWRAHAHNDYEHPRPLLDALDHRFGSVEADIFLVGDQLLVAHDATDLDPGRTLESLYLDPLAARVRAHHGSVYRGYRKPLQLLIDIKTEGASTYLELDRRLRRHRHLFTTYAHGRVYPGVVTAVISGDRAARVPMEAQSVRRAFYDGRLADLVSTTPAPARVGRGRRRPSQHGRPRGPRSVPGRPPVGVGAICRHHSFGGHVSRTGEPSATSHLRPNAAKRAWRRRLTMAISISVVVLLVILMVIFLRNGALKFSHAAICVLLGFHMAGTSLAPTIHHGLTATADIVSSLKP